MKKRVYTDHNRYLNRHPDVSRRTIIIGMRVSTTEHATFTAAAKELGMTLPEFIRKVAWDEDQKGHNTE